MRSMKSPGLSISSDSADINMSPAAPMLQRAAFLERGDMAAWSPPLQARATIPAPYSLLHNPFIWLIRLARNPAPKPLSMFTTLMPLAQEFSMLSSADSPPKLAP